MRPAAGRPRIDGVSEVTETFPASFSASDLTVRRAAAEDWPRLWPIWHAVVAAGDTYPDEPDTPEEVARERWMLRPPGQTWLAADPQGRVVGTYILAPNRVGLGDHVANAGFMVAPQARRRGVGRLLGQHCLAQAKASGYRAMQFNAVVATNVASINLWLSLGFTIVGTVPRAFRHRVHGEVDLHIMHRFL